MSQEQARAASACPASPAEPSLLRAIVAAYGRPYFLLGLLKAAGDALNFAGPLLLNLLLRHLASRGGGSHGSGSGSGEKLRLLGWQAEAGAPLFGYACAALLAGSLVLKVRAWCAPRVCLRRHLRQWGQAGNVSLPCTARRLPAHLPTMCARRLCWVHSMATARR